MGAAPSAPAPPDRCWDWRPHWHGGCPRGAECKFKHPEVIGTPCKFFAKGACFLGDRCEFTHSRDVPGGASIEWQVQGEGTQWIPCWPAVAEKLEAKFNDSSSDGMVPVQRPKHRLQHPGGLSVLALALPGTYATYDLDVRNMLQINSETKKERELRRVVSRFQNVNELDTSVTTHYGPEAFLKKFKGTAAKYKDHMFRGSGALFKNPADPKPTPVNSWLRVSDPNFRDGWKADRTLISDAVSASDVVQGQLGDCWLISSMAIVAQYPHVLKKLFKVYHPSSGICCVQLYWREASGGGKWKDIWIDDTLPVDSSGRPCYCLTRNGQSWGSLLEKAYAKQKGSYQAMIGGHEANALSAMTGVRCEHWKPNASDTDWKVLAGWKGYFARHLLMCASSSHGKDIQDKYGLIGGHSYTIIGFYKGSKGVYYCGGASDSSDNPEVTREGQHQGMKETKLVRLRNPWGSTKYKGAWHDKSDEWESVAAKAVGLAKKLEVSKCPGAFWMSFDDFCAWTTDVTVCQKALKKCRYWVSGKGCKDGDQCLFWHD